MKVKKTPLDGLLVIEPDVFVDHRGFLLETWHRNRFASARLNMTFVQDNHSRSQYGVLRGLHYQLHNPQGKLVFVVSGKVFDVAVDLRIGSPTFGRWFGTLLSDENHRQMYIPPGFAHGFCVLSEKADFMYKCTNFYSPDDQYGVHWNDPDLGIEWPIKDPILSEKDAKLPFLKNVPEENLPELREFS